MSATKAPVAELEQKSTADELRTQLAELEETKKTVGSSGTSTLLQKLQSDLQKRLGVLTKKERGDLEAKIRSAHEDLGFKVKIVTEEEMNKAQDRRVSDERAATLMEGAESLGVTLDPEEIVVIKNGGGVDIKVSTELTKEFNKELKSLGVGYQVMASKGSLGGRVGARGEITYDVGTILSKTYQGEEYIAEIQMKDGEKIIVGVKGKGIKGEVFHSLSGAAQKATGYNTRGTQWWKAKAPPTASSTNGKES